jgi:mRNA interferase MazF
MDNLKIRRGDIYYADLPEEEEGSIQAGRRPVLITQSNWLNRKSPTVIVAAVTSKLKNTDWDCHLVLPMLKGLPKQSMILAEQRKTISKTQLICYRCTLDRKLMKQVTKALHAAEREDEEPGRQRRSRASKMPDK